MKTILASWQFWALASAGFAALTAIFAKIGVSGVSSDFATLIRTVVILGIVTELVLATDQWQPFALVPQRTWVFLALSGVATGGLGFAISGR
jgi:transporter family protein